MLVFSTSKLKIDSVDWRIAETKRDTTRTGQRYKLSALFLFVRCAELGTRRFQLLLRHLVTVSLVPKQRAGERHQHAFFEQGQVMPRGFRQAQAQRCRQLLILFRARQVQFQAVIPNLFGFTIVLIGALRCHFRVAGTTAQYQHNGQ